MNKKTLDKVKKGSVFIIKTLPVDEIRFQLMRMGISEGDKVFCLERLPGGTIVLQKKRQEIAIGSELAKTILVSIL